MIKLRTPMYSKGPDNLIIILPSIIYQKMDWREIMNGDVGFKDSDISYSLHFKWFKMQLSLGLNYKKK